MASNVSGTAEISELIARNDAQEIAIKALWVRITAAEKRNEHAQPYIAKLKSRNAELEARLIDEARADWFFKN